MTVLASRVIKNRSLEQNSLCQGPTIYTTRASGEFTSAISSLLPWTYCSIVIRVYWEHLGSTSFLAFTLKVHLAHSDAKPGCAPKYDKWRLLGYSQSPYPKQNTSVDIASVTTCFLRGWCPAMYRSFCPFVFSIGIAVVLGDYQLM